MSGIESLRPEERKVLLMSVFAHVDQKDIADRLGVAVGTVKSRLSRARSRLAQAR